MIRIKALNESASSSSCELSNQGVGITREAQEEGLYQLYSDALKCLSSGHEEAARQMLLKLNDHLNNKVNTNQLNNVSQLKYLTLKNLGLISSKDSINYLLDALEIDSSDVTLWLKTGQKAAKAGNFQLARNCYEEAHYISQYNWIAIDRLMETYFVLHDLYSCFKLACLALEREEGYRKAQILLKEVVRLHPAFGKELKAKFRPFIDEEEDEEYTNVIDSLRQLKLKRQQMFDDDRAKQESKRPKLFLNFDLHPNSTFASIGQKLLSIHERIKKNNIFPSTPIDVTFDESAMNSNASSDVNMIGGESSANTSPDEGNSEQNTQNGLNGTEGEQKENKEVKDKEVKESPKEEKREKVERRRESASRSSNSIGLFPMELLDKRRSSRVKNSLSRSKGDIDERNVLESIYDLLPESIKMLREEEETIQNNARESDGNKNEKKNEDNTNQTKVKTQIYEPDLIKKFIEKIKIAKVRRKVLRIYELIEDYLLELSRIKGLSIPGVFNDLYIIYRDYYSLPCASSCLIGMNGHLSLDHIWMILTANELHFDKSESIFLSQMIVPMEVACFLNKDRYFEYQVRVITLRGIKENDNQFLEYALELLGDSELEFTTANKMTIKSSVIKSLLESQSQDNMSQMMSEHNYDALIQLLSSKPESEITSHEKKLLSEAIICSKQWQRGIEIMSSRDEFSTTCLVAIKKCLETGHRGRLNHRLALKLVKSAAAGYSVLPWICIYWGILAEEVSQESHKESHNKINLVKFFKLGHSYLGKRGTCTSHDGEFLLLALNNFIESDTNEDTETLKCFTCLFNFPARKVSTSAYSSSPTHSSPHVKLKWENCQVIYNYFVPEDLPEFDSIFRLTGIQPDIEPILIKIVEQIPDHLRPKEQSVAILKHIEAGDALPDETNIESNSVTENLYYFLADYYFKNKEFKKASDFYLNDLGINPNRFDSWAGSALSRSSQLEQQLISGDHIESRFYRHAAAALRCFERALKIDTQSTKLWIEYGNLAYNIASHASRLRKTALFMQSPTDSNQVNTHADQLLAQHEDMLRIAKFCFESANKTDTTEETWLPYYMLGKVMEKKNLLAALKYYEWAEMCLYSDGASYPKKIQYHSPPSLAVEALEIHYRIHAACLKQLITKKCSSRILRRIKIHLIRAMRSPFSKQISLSSANSTSNTPLDQDYLNALGTSVGTSSSSSYPMSRIKGAVNELMTDLLDFVCDREKTGNDNQLKEQLIQYCLTAMKRCINRYPAHYKSIYRLAYYYHMINDNQTAKYLLLGGHNLLNNPKLVIISNEIDPVSNINPTGTTANIEVAGSSASASNAVSTVSTTQTPSDSNVKVNSIPGLFAEKKTNNLFNGIWRIPIDDIDRPGSFSSHMFRSTFLLIRVCTLTHDCQTLCTISLQLNRTPELGKKYLRDADRQMLARFAFESCSLLLKSHLHSGRDKAILNEVQRIVEKFVKANVFVNEANALLKCFYQFAK